MPKVLKVLFFTSLALAVILSGIYYFYFYLQPSISEKNAPGIPADTDISDLQNARFSLKAEEEIQALFLRVDNGLLYYKERQDSSIPEKTVLIENPTLYVCQSQSDKDIISVDPKNPGSFTLIDPRELNRELQSLEPLLIVTLREESGNIKVNYIAARRC